MAFGFRKISYTGPFVVPYNFHKHSFRFSSERYLRFTSIHSAFMGSISVKDWEKDPDLTLLMTTQLFPYHEVSDPLFPYRVQMYLYPTLHQHKRLNRTGLPVVSHWLCCLTFVVRSKDWIDGTWKHISVFGSPVSLSKLVICLWLYFWNTNTLVSLDKFYHHH